MKKIKILLSILMLLTLTVSLQTPVNAADEKELEEVFSTEYIDGSTTIDKTQTGNYYIQDFKKVTELPQPKNAGNKKVYKVSIGREILDETEYRERKSDERKRITASDKYDDGRGTHLYAEIKYTREAINDLVAIDMQSIYCNSSGSSLSKYTVLYGQSGLRSDNMLPINQRKSVNVSPIFKTFSTEVNWVPVLCGNGLGIASGVAGVNQQYTLKNGYSKNWVFNIT